MADSAILRELGIIGQRAVGPLLKGPTRQRLKGRKDRAEEKVKKIVRAACVERDGDCRLCDWENNPDDWHADDLHDCDPLSVGHPTEWAHLHAKRRSKTRGQAPEVRHDTQHSLCLCRYHHREYDEHRLKITALTRKGCDGPLKFERAK